MIIFRIVWLWGLKDRICIPINAQLIFGKIIAEMIAVRRKKKLTVTSCRYVIFSNFPADTCVIIIIKKAPLLIQGAQSHMVSDQGFYSKFDSWTAKNRNDQNHVTLKYMCSCLRSN